VATIFSKLINSAVSDTIDERVLNKGKSLNTFQMTENNNVVVNSASEFEEQRAYKRETELAESDDFYFFSISEAIGCSVVNVGSQDIIEGCPHLVLGLIWQIIRIGLLSKINIKVSLPLPYGEH
jgi:plastin-1